MFVFYFAVASAITPPVALAAFAASSITKADPMKTGFSAVKSGIVMFTIPFVFAIYPELLLIDQAVIDPSTGAFLSGYDGQIDVAWMVLLLARVALALYLVSSAMAAFDQKPLGVGQIIIRIILAVFVMAKPLEVYGAAMVAGLGIIVMHSLASRRIAAA
jgi:TRAP-type uncharacterized transport system fused permease subunit